MINIADSNLKKLQDIAKDAGHFEIEKEILARITVNHRSMTHSIAHLNRPPCKW
jgi:hypothetical protein